MKIRVVKYVPDGRVRAVRGALYRARAEAESSLMAKGIYGFAARQSGDGEGAGGKG